MSLYKRGDDEQMRALTLFRKRAAELETYRFYAERGNWTVLLDEPEKSVFPDDQDFRAFLTAFRPFLLKADPLYLNRIWDVVISLTDDPSQLRMARTAVQTMRKTTFIYEIEQCGTYGPEEMFDIFINAEIFHNDIKKQEFLARLPAAGLCVWKSTSMMFIDYVLREIGFLDGVAKSILAA
jgi:hypothetical protein